MPKTKNQKLTIVKGGKKTTAPKTDRKSESPPVQQKPHPFQKFANGPNHSKGGGFNLQHFNMRIPRRRTA